METKIERNKTLDIAKGIAIILMVIGHCYSTSNCILTLIYGFHMPLFFMISGIIYGKRIIENEQYEFSVPHIVIKFMKPYFSWSVMFALFLIILQTIGGKLDVASLCSNYLWEIISLQGVSVLWYLPCVLLTELIFIFLNKMCRKFLLPVGVGLYLVALLFPVDGELNVFWRSFIGLGFFMIGNYIPVLVDKFRKVMDFYHISVIVTCVCIFFLYVITSMRNGMVSLVDLKFNNPLLYTVNAVLGSVSFLFLSALLSSRVKTRCIDVLTYFGRKTLFVLEAHMFLIEVIRLIDYKMFGNILPKLGLVEGIVFGLLVCSILWMLSALYEKSKQNELC